MKVLKKINTDNWKYKILCSQCDSELEAEKGDVKYEYHDGDCRDPGYETWDIICPVCST